MEKEQILKLIGESIKDNRAGVMEALKNSYVSVSPNVTDKELSLIIEREFTNGNGYLVYHLEEVMKKEFEAEGVDYSSAGGWLGTVVGVLPSVLGLFGNKGAAPTQQDGGLMMQQYMMAQQQAEQARRRREEQEREDERARRNTNMIIFGSVGGVVVIGVVLLIVFKK